MIEFLIIVPVLFTFPTVFLWAQFEKAGRKGWETLVPFYNLYIFLKIIKKPLWWYLFLLFPFINVFMYMLMLVEMAKCFGKFGLGQQFLAVVFPVFYFPYLAVRKKEEPFLDPATRKEPKKSTAREWTDAIIFAVVAAVIIRTFLVEAYTIPTSSMEKSLLVGDYLFVSKIAYGPKVPNTLLSLPFIHNTIPLTHMNSYLPWIELPYWRLPGLEKVHRNDAVVFNYPLGDTVSTRFQSNISYYTLVKEYGRKRVWTDKKDFGDIVYRPVDKEENFIKRCIGLPGDTLQIINRKVYIDGKENHDPGKVEFEYKVITDGHSINPMILDRLNITEGWRTDVPGEFIYMLTAQARDALKKLPIVKSIQISNIPKGVRDPQIFPYSANFKWNRDNYGPIYIPAKGATVALNMKDLPLYRRIIRVYEKNKLQVKNGKIYINGKVANHYTFKKNYYWMMGDNRDNSADSRYWGFVPENHIEGKAVFIWMSLDPRKSWLDGKIRWNRIFTFVH